MMTTLGPQLRKQRRRMGLSLDDLAKLTGISKPYLSLVENSKTKGVPSDAKLTVLEQTLKFPTGTLLAQAHLAKTPPDVRNVLKDLLTKQSDSQSAAPGSEGSGAAPAKAPGGAPLSIGKSLDEAYLSGALQSLVEDRAGNLQPARFRQVPLINKVAAGYPTDFTDLDYPARVADEYIPAPESAVNDPTEGGGGGGFAARVSGQSMLPTYRDGDIIVFSTTPDPKDGDDCFVRLEDGRTTFKRVFFLPPTDGTGRGRVRLEPLNPKFSPKLLPAEKIAGIYKATWISRAL